MVWLTRWGGFFGDRQAATSSTDCAAEERHAQETKGQMFRDRQLQSEHGSTSDKAWDFHDEVPAERLEQPHASQIAAGRGNGFQDLQVPKEDVLLNKANQNGEPEYCSSGADAEDDSLVIAAVSTDQDANTSPANGSGFQRQTTENSVRSDSKDVSYITEQERLVMSAMPSHLSFGTAAVTPPASGPSKRASDLNKYLVSELQEVKSYVNKLLPKLEVMRVNAPSTHLQLCINSTVPLLRHLRLTLNEAEIPAQPQTQVSGTPVTVTADPTRSTATSVVGPLFVSEQSMRSAHSSESNNNRGSVGFTYDTVFSAPPEDSQTFGATGSYVGNGARGFVRTLSLTQGPVDIGSKRKSFMDDSQNVSFFQDSRGDKVTSRNPYYVHPEKPFRLVWDFCALSLILMMSITIPLELTFYWNSAPPLVFEIFSAFVDGFFLMDIVINFITAFHEGHGISGRLVTHFSGMAKHYAKGWLVIDVLASFPYMHSIRLLGHGDNDETSTKAQSLQMVRVMKIAKVARAMKVLRILKLNSLMQIVEEKLVAAQSMTVAFQLMKMTVVMLIISHIVACCWFAMAEFRSDNTSTWLSEQGLQDAEGYQQYICAFYFAITTGTTVGYGDITPENTLEQAGTSVLLILSVGYIGQFLGRVSQMVNSLRQNENLISQSKREALLFMKQRSVPKELQFKVLRYIEHTSETQALTSLDAKIMDRLSRSLQNELALSISGHVFKHFPLFEEMSERFLMALCQVGRTVRCGVGEVIVAEEQPAHEMFWIVRGEVAVFRRGRHLSSLRDNDWFGELALFVPGVIRNATIRCETHCECLVLHHDDFQETMKEFPDLKREYLKLAGELRRGNMSGLKLTCVHCGSNDHLSRDCPLNQQSSQAKVSSASSRASFF